MGYFNIEKNSAKWVLTSQIKCAIIQSQQQTTTQRDVVHYDTEINCPDDESPMYIELYK